MDKEFETSWKPGGTLIGISGRWASRAEEPIKEVNELSSSSSVTESEVYSDRMNDAIATAAADQCGVLTDSHVVVDDRLFQHSSSKKVHRGMAGWLLKTACGYGINDNYVRLAVGRDGLGEPSLMCDRCFNTQAGRQLVQALNIAAEESDELAKADMDN